MVRGALLSKSLSFNYLGKTVLYSNILTIVLTIILAYNGFQHWAIIIPQIISSIIIFIMYESRLQIGFHISPIINVKVAYRYTKKTIGSLIGFNLVNYWARNTDNLIVGKVYGTNDLGIYNRAYFT
ncbi:MAG: hypothetical protein EOO85_32910 [Pedobacter sp.]|nr:MAG: hypothetical protein EOO85_32910 [Pedobacter sp.]